MQIVQATENVIDSDEHFFNPGWFQSQELKLFELEITGSRFRTIESNPGSKTVGGFMTQINPT